MSYNNLQYHSPNDTLAEILGADDAQILLAWLRQQKILHYCEYFSVTLSHAGIYPHWTLNEAIDYARELEAIIADDASAPRFFSTMYGNNPTHWQRAYKDELRWRFITNAFTRMRFCEPDGELVLDVKGDIDSQIDLLPWFSVKNRKMKNQDVIFGHWAALEGETNTPHALAIDTGCVWGRQLTALRLDDRQRFSTPRQLLSTVKGSITP